MLIAALSTLACSCVKEYAHVRLNTLYSESKVPIKAYPVLPEGWNPLSRAVSDITQIDDTLLRDHGFGVYAFYTGRESFSSSKDSSEYTRFGLVLNNREFEHTGSVWRNAGTAEFWPASTGEKLTLFAYAPYDTWSSSVQYTGTVPYIVYDNYVAQSLSESELSKQRDILWGTNTSGLTHKNVEKGDYESEGNVDMHFRHATAKVSFTVTGSLPGEVRTLVTSGNITSTNGPDGTPEDGPHSESIGSPVTTISSGDEYSEGNILNRRYYKDFTASQRQTKTETYTQTRYRVVTQSRTARYTTQGKRYLVEYMTLKGFNRTGTLMLENTSAYAPTWTNVTPFTGDTPEYNLSSSNVLSQSLRYVDATTVRNNFGTYMGVTEEPTDMMSGYFLYAIPKTVSSASDQIDVSLKYHALNVAGDVSVTETREIIQVATRTLTRTCNRTRVSEPIKVQGTTGWTGRSYTTPDESEFVYTQELEDAPWGGWSNWSNPAWGNYTEYSQGNWQSSTETLSNATVNYNDDPAPVLNGKIITSFQGGRAYALNVIIAGDKINLDVVPRPWELEEMTFDYTSNINDVIQALTYDSNYIDYADASGNVYINNRMGRFYFRLGRGKYVAWQASLVGDAAFGFTDENGNFLLDGQGNRVNSVRGGIDPDVTNNIYIKAINSSSTVTSRAKLRIYYIDADNDVTAALNLVNMQGVNEWTIVQNAN